MVPRGRYAARDERVHRHRASNFCCQLAMVLDSVVVMFPRGGNRLFRGGGRCDVMTVAATTRYYFPVMAGCLST